MEQGKKICETLKGIRRDIAAANEIDYNPAECHHEGDCAGTCPKCESEMRWLEQQLQVRQRLGKAVKVAGLTLALTSFASSCNPGGGQEAGYLEQPYNDTTEICMEGDVVIDSAEVVNPEKAEQTPESQKASKE